MQKFSAKKQISADTQTVWRYLHNPEAIIRLLPPWQKINNLGISAHYPKQGSAVSFTLSEYNFLRFKWQIDITETGQDTLALQARRGPLLYWQHTINVQPDEIEPGHCILSENIKFKSLPFSGAEVRRQLTRNFTYRHQQLNNDLAFIEKISSEAKCLAVTGASGLIGTQLVALLRLAGHRVLTLSRKPVGENSDEIMWQPDKGILNPAHLEGVDCVIHLAGEPISKNWTPKQKAYLMQSRAQAIRTLHKAFAAMEKPPQTFICASAVGFYGNVPEGTVDESGLSPDQGFAPALCCTIELEADAIAALGIRTVKARLGVVLSRRGGALAKLLPAFWLGGGGPLGHGRQGFSWVALEDAVRAFITVALDKKFAGAVNIVAPQACTQQAFAAALGRALRRPAFMPMPAPVVRLLFGQMGQELLLEGCFAEPTVLLRNGFTFSYPKLEDALYWEVMGKVKQ